MDGHHLRQRRRGRRRRRGRVRPCGETAPSPIPKTTDELSTDTASLMWKMDLLSCGNRPEIDGSIKSAEISQQCLILEGINIRAGVTDSHRMHGCCCWSGMAIELLLAPLQTRLLDFELWPFNYWTTVELWTLACILAQVYVNSCTRSVQIIFLNFEKREGPGKDAWVYVRAQTYAYNCCI